MRAARHIDSRHEEGEEEGRRLNARTLGILPPRDVDELLDVTNLLRLQPRNTVSMRSIARKTSSNLLTILALVLSLSVPLSTLAIPGLPRWLISDLQLYSYGFCRASIQALVGLAKRSKTRLSKLSRFGGSQEDFQHMTRVSEDHEKCIARGIKYMAER